MSLPDISMILFNQLHANIIEVVIITILLIIIRSRATKNVIPNLFAELLLYIHRSIEPKSQSHDQTSNHCSCNNGTNIQVGCNHSLLSGNLNSSNCSALLTLGELTLHRLSSLRALTTAFSITLRTPFLGGIKFSDFSEQH